MNYQMSSYRRLVSWFYHYFWIGLDWIYPPNCAGCGVENIRWCVDCNREVHRVLPPYCQICGQTIQSGQVCARCCETRPQFTQLRSWAIFGGNLRSAIHRLKYEGDISLGEEFSRFLVRCFISQNWSADLTVPVPLALDRSKERGYNQASLLAKPMALALDIQYSTQALQRTRETRQQVGLSAIERRENVKDAFYARSELVRNKNILVVDDVTTTGSTLDACASALLNAGAKNVFCLTLARAATRNSISREETRIWQ